MPASIKILIQSRTAKGHKKIPEDPILSGLPEFYRTATGGIRIRDLVITNDASMSKQMAENQHILRALI